MNLLIFQLLTVGLYVVSGLLLARRLFEKRGSELASFYLQKNVILSLSLAAVVMHMGILYSLIVVDAGLGLNFGFYNAISLMLWLIALLLTLASFTKPLENLGIVAFPVAGLCVLLEMLFPASHILLREDAMDLRFHILISIFAYSLLTIAAIQASLLAVQNKYLRNKHPGGFIRALPPLETMESLLFQLIGLGFVFMSLALITGMIYLQDMFQQHLVHKTVLAIVSWGLFGILLWGRWRFGWRGRTAIRWTISAFIVLLLSYLGSKLVMEIILSR